MTTQLIPFIFASLFVAGCFAILALQRWPEIVSNGLGGIFGLIVALLAAEILANHMPRQYVAAVAMAATSTHAPYGATTSNPTGQKQVSGSVPNNMPQAFND